MSNPAYGSHMPVLKRYLELFKPRTVFEFGCGTNSTPLFIETCESVIAIEMQKPEWFIKVLREYGSHPNFKFMCMPGPDSGPEYLGLLGSGFDLVFVDGHMRRPLQIKAAFSKTRTIITHDTDQPCYGWSGIELPEGWEWIDVVETWPWTAVCSCDSDVRDWARTYSNLSCTAMSDKKFPAGRR